MTDMPTLHFFYFGKRGKNYFSLKTLKGHLKTKNHAMLQICYSRNLEYYQKKVHPCYERAFDQSVSRSFGNGSAWNVVNFGVENSLLRNSENDSNNFLV